MDDDHNNGTYQQEGAIEAQYEEVQQESEAQSNMEGKIHISEEVITQIASKALSTIEGVAPSSPGLMANLRMGRRAVGGVRISVSDDQASPEIQVDTYVSIRYGLRIPDVCWDVQEAIKDQVERFSGYSVKSVNVYVQDITFPEKDEAPAPEQEAARPSDAQ